MKALLARYRWPGDWWKFRCPFSPYFVFPRQGTYWETNFCEGRIVLHLKPVIWHRSATRFRDLQGEMRTLHDEHFGCRPLCLKKIICKWSCLKSIHWLQEYLLLAIFREIISCWSWLLDLERLWFKQTPFSCSVPGSGKYEGLLWKGLGANWDYQEKNARLWFFVASINVQ